MATVTGYTAQRMKQIEDSAVVDGNVVGNNLILVTHAGTNIDAGNVRGPQGPQGVPGEVTAAQLDAATDPSVQSGNDLVNGSDGKLFFDHQKNYFHNVPVFNDAAARDAVVTAVGGQACYLFDTTHIQVYKAASGWKPPFGSPWGSHGYKTDTSPRNGFTSTLTEIHTSLRNTVTTVAGRLLKATLNIIAVQASPTPGIYLELYNVTGAVAVGRLHQQGGIGAGGFACSPSFVFPSVAGTTVYTPRIMATSSGTIDVPNSAAEPCRFTIEDIGPSTSTLNY